MSKYLALLTIIPLLPKGKFHWKRNAGDLFVPQFVTKEQFLYLDFPMEILNKVFDILVKDGKLKLNNDYYKVKDSQIDYFEVIG